MVNDISGLRVIVTGASSGIGAAVAIALARQGASVAVHYNSNEEGAKAIALAISDVGRAAVLVGGDLSISKEAERVVSEASAELGGIDVLINNAGAMVRRATLREIDDSIYEAIGDINIRSAIMTGEGGFALP